MSGAILLRLIKNLLCGHTAQQNFSDCIIRAVNRGYDSDTVGAVAGMIAGASYGYKRIPKHFLDNLMWKDELQKTAIKLYELRAYVMLLNLFYNDHSDN